MRSHRVVGFLPSDRGFHFANDFPSGPVLRIPMGLFRVPIGNAANGLCGGMVFAIRDLFEVGLSPPPDRAPPAGGSLLFRYLVRRLFASFNLPDGPLRYQLWQALPTADARLGVHGVLWRTVHREWPRVQGDLDTGRLTPLGLIRTRSFNPLELGRNHQVLAYGYDLEGSSGRLVIRVYDPNHPDRDDLALSLSVARSDPQGPITYLPEELPVRGFFRTRYRWADPSALVRAP